MAVGDLNAHRVLAGDGGEDVDALAARGASEDRGVTTPSDDLTEGMAINIQEPK